MATPTGTMANLKLPMDDWWYPSLREGDKDPNEFLLLDFDPGGRAMGWFMVSVNVRAFATPEAKVLRYLNFWDCGELSGTETEILNGAMRLIDWCIIRTKRNNRVVPPCPPLHIRTEDFDLTQTIGSSENLLSPVRQNAVLRWELEKRGMTLGYQNRNERMSITRDRLKLYGFEGSFRKDEFAAMQHGVVHLKSLKRQSISFPWQVQKKGDRSL